MCVDNWLRDFSHLKLWLDWFLFNLLDFLCNGFWNLCGWTESKFRLIISWGTGASIDLFVWHSLGFLILVNNCLSDQICGFWSLHRFSKNDWFGFVFFDLLLILSHLLWFIFFLLFFWLTIIRWVLLVLLLIITVVKFSL